MLKFKLLLGLLGILCSSTTFAQDLFQFSNTAKPVPYQNYVRCYTMEMDSIQRENNPQKEDLNQFEQWLAPKIKEYRKLHNGVERAPILTIPVIFHIFTDGAGADNVSAALIQAQIDQLNIDYRNLAGSSHPAAADSEVEFCLATLDPSDNALVEPGINRITSYGDGPFTDTQIDGTMKAATQWDPNNYMNIWVADISGGLLGWAQFPNSSGLGGLNANNGNADTDGVVILHTSVGSVATPNPNGGIYGMGRTLTHEVGHWLGLRHLWGDSGACGTDDFCNDTPECTNPQYSNPPNCTKPTQCGTPRMIENYMDYSGDGCMDIFTADQVTRIRTVMTNCPRRTSLASSTKCAPPVPPAPTISFVSKGGTVVNEGTDCGFQDIVLDLEIALAPSADATVTFSMASGAATQGVDYDIIPSSVIFSGGSTADQQVTIRVYNDALVETDELFVIDFAVATSGDAVAATNDFKDHDLTIIDNDKAPTPASSAVLIDVDFESGGGGFTSSSNSPTAFGLGTAATASGNGWTISNTNATTFAFTNDRSCGFGCDKSQDGLFTPSFSLVGYQTANLTFDHAFSGVSRNGFDESGAVLVSTDGGTNYTSVATMANTSTSTGGAGRSTPWVNGVTINLSAFVGNADVRVAFLYNDDGGRMYGMAIDNVVIRGESNTQIQTTDNTVNPNNSTVPASGTVHFWDPASGDIMATIENLSTWDYQCTRVEVDRDPSTAANNTVPFWDSDAAHALHAKTFYVDPANNTPTGTYNIKLFYTEAEIAAWEAATGDTRNNLKIIKVGNTPISTINTGNYSAYNIEVVPATLNTFGTDVTLTATFNSGFSGFGIGNPGPPPGLLPIELLSFKGEKQGKNALLTWTTENELNNDHYTLLRSRDGINFEPIAKLKAKGNQRQGIFSYEYLDQSTQAGINYYRLSQTDTDDETTLFHIISLDFGTEDIPTFSLAPNPASNYLDLSFATTYEESISLEIINMVGQTVENQADLPVEVGNNKIALQVKDYAPGMYIIRLKQADHILTRRFMKK
ncbi:MAG: T9SS type A sorting domain-containing protein [Aureispira sp.]|nr:T9SS type A sorting domain-containing protein [Aureispira sp.]